MKGNAGKRKSVSRRVWWTRSVVLLSPSSSILLLAVNILSPSSLFIVTHRPLNPMPYSYIRTAFCLCRLDLLAFIT